MLKKKGSKWTADQMDDNAIEASNIKEKEFIYIFGKLEYFAIL